MGTNKYVWMLLVMASSLNAKKIVSSEEFQLIENVNVQNCKEIIWKNNDPNKDLCMTLHKLTSKLAILNDINFLYIIFDALEFDAFDIYRNLQLKVAVGVILAIRLTLGTYLYIIIIHYERFGQDPKKRSLKNQLIVLICQVNVIISWLNYPINVYNSMDGPVPTWIAKIQIVNTEAAGISIFLALDGIIILQNLMLFKFSEMASINEDFWARFIYIWNWSFSYGLAMSFNYSGPTVVSKMEFLTGNLETEEANYTTRRILWALIILTLIIGYLTKTIKKWVENKKDQNVVQPFNQIYNNRAVNDSLINRRTGTVIIFISVLIIFFQVFNRQFHKDDPIRKKMGLLYTELFTQFFYGCLFPLIVVCLNKNLRRHLREM